MNTYLKTRMTGLLLLFIFLPLLGALLDKHLPVGMAARLTPHLHADQSATGESPGVVYRVQIKGAITPANMEMLQDAISTAESNDARALLVVLDTPGGLASSMDEMIRSILSARVPVLTFVGPAGATSGSAGVYILYASHVAAMAPATNLGSATPVMMGPGGSPGGGGKEGSEGSGESKGGKDGTSQPAGQTGPGGLPAKAGADDAVNLKRKQLNHAIAQIQSLAEYHDRNADFAVKTVTEAKNITSRQALKIGAIDMMANTAEEVIQKAHGRKVRMLTEYQTLDLENVRIETIEKDSRMEFLSILSNPNLAYILMMVGVMGILAEVQYPGAVVPGVIGSISLILGLYAMQTLPINYAGLGLILLGFVFFIAELFTAAFGILALAGVISLLIGSFMLVDSSKEMMQISTSLIIGTVAVVGGLMSLMVYLGARSLRQKPTSGDDALVGEEGQAETEVSKLSGKVYVHSEYWNARSQDEKPIEKGSRVVITARKGMTLIVRRAED